MKCTLRFVFLFTISFFLLSIHISASADYYVSTTGNDIWNGSSESPWATLQHAVDTADDVIIVLDGTYTENIDITRQVILRSYDWVENMENDSAIVAANISTDHVFDISSPNVIIEGFTIYGATGSQKAGVYISGETNCTIANNICGLSSGESNYHGIYLHSASQNNISHNTCSYNNITGIEMYASTNNTLFSNILTNNNYYGIDVTYTSESNIISNNTFTDTGTHLRFFISDNNIALYNSFSGGGSYRILLDSSDSNRFYLNDINGSSSLIDADSGYTNYWSSEIEINYLYNGKWRTGYLGNYYSDHALTDSNGDGITDNAYDLPADEPDDLYPVATTPDNYTYLERGLLAYFPFNGNADDGGWFYNNNGVVTGADLTTDRFNKPDSAYLFGGSAESDKIDCGNNSSLDVSRDITLSAWIKPSSLTGRIIKKRGDGGYELDISAEYVRVSINGSSRADASLSGMENQWIFIVVKKEGAVSKMFVNGEQQGNTYTETEGIFSHRSNLLIGIHSTWGQFDGVIDEVRIYNRALSQEEITRLYNEGKSKINAGIFMLLFN